MLLAASATAFAYARHQAGLFRKLLESQRRQREIHEQFRTILYSIGDAVITTDTGGRVQTMNPVAEQLTGWTEADARGKPLDDVFVIINQESRTPVTNPVTTVLRDGVIVELANHTQLIARDGTEHAIADSAAPIRNSAGEVSGVVLVVSDVTAQYQAREALRKSEARLSFALETIHTGAWELDLLDHAASRTLTHDRIFGYETLLPDWTYEMFLEHVLPEDRPIVDRRFREATAAQSEWNVECRIRRSDGEVRWILAAGRHERNADGKAVRMAGIVQDITERHKAGEALRKSEEHYRLLAENTTDVIWVLDTETENYRYISPSVERLRGYSVAEVMEQGAALAFTPDSLQYFRSVAPNRQERFSQGHIEFFTDEVRQVHKDGHIVDVEVTSRLTRNLLTGHVESTGVTRDISDRKRAEEALRESESKLKAALGSMTDAVSICDATGRVIEINDAFAAFHRFRDKTECAMKISDYPDILEVFTPNGKLLPLDMWAVPRALRGESVMNAEFNLRRKDTGETWVGSYSFGPIRDQDGAVVGSVVVGRDITEHKRMAEKLQQTERMESLGKLAAGVAHDLNNIITPIILSVDMLRGEEDPKSREMLISSIEECAKRGASVINQVLTFARGAKGERTTLQLKVLANEMEKVIHETFPKNIVVTGSIQADLWPVKGNATQIHQVLLNLCVNARDAMPNGGDLRILGENVEIDENFAAMVPDAKVGNYAMLEVSDTGIGIPQEIIGNIFDPFFTTKELGKGTGLGLSTSIGIVRSHGGFITVRSEEGHGSTFKAFLPAETVGAQEQAHSGFTEMPQGTGETILIVDDEIVICKATSMVLEKNGYRVLTATGGVCALTLYREYATSVEVVITDVMMPDMNGIELTRALKEINPRQKVIASTGHANQVRQAELKELGVDVILNKPYDAIKLLTTLRSVIGA